MITLTYIFAAVLLLGLCIFVHELGHLLGGRMVGIKAKVFSLGYGRGFIKKKIGDTTYQITLIPLGGYCQFYGEDPSEAREGKGFEFLSAHPLKRIVTVVMGPLFNLFFGILIFFIMNFVGYSKETNRILIPSEMVQGGEYSAAYSAGLRTGDEIIAINGEEIKSFSDIQSKIFFSEGKALDITVRRNGETKTFSVTPKSESGEMRFSIGVIPYTEGITVTNVSEGGPAYAMGLKPGDIITHIDGKEVHFPSEFSEYIQKNFDRELTVSFLRGEDTRTITVRPAMTDIFAVAENPEKQITFMGDEIFKRNISKGLVRIDGKIIDKYEDFLSEVTKNSNRPLIIDVGKDRYKGVVSISSRAIIGVGIGVSFEMNHVKYGTVDALKLALIEPWEFIYMNIKGFAMLFSGEIGVRENLSGPIRIAKIAGDVLTERGFADFFLLMARISIILMFMNLLPIPAVDGSHILLYTLELVRGKPLSEAMLAKIQGFGIIFLIGLSIFVIVNDISMLPFVQNLFK
ncbi:MAG: putative zinc metalloprotease [Spirochaetes bacterium ADurb.Bin218]|jgi:regulator of sigma E protease|nr:RIP metalloprotease RseP [Spirochaetota bacterium]OQA99732.1 MAG: putative zinc metalloprotease [Spirochaetes bacterium ADurb.Bin218]HOV08134.1 RIP metalloprotease RseP [Spirochaetota bacterium]HPD78943.1 RIP metalloprotease RseP [Spirochaetota bacterium]HRS62754.1 RIP metalloprotease RseP [Spirochaetota bacterium]